MTREIQGGQIDIASIDGSLLTAVDAATLEGSNKAFYRNAGNLNAGTILDARLPATISSDITGNAATCTLATDSNKLDNIAAASWAKLSSPAFIGTPTAPTQTAGNNSTRLATTAFVTTAVGSGATVTSSSTLAYSGPSTTTSWSHGQATMPLMVQINFINVIAQGGFTAGDIVSLNNMASSTDGGSGYFTNGIGVELTTSQVIVRISARDVPYISTTYGTMAFATANWSMLIRIIT
jgi:hypothetical protein